MIKVCLLILLLSVVCANLKSDAISTRITVSKRGGILISPSDPEVVRLAWKGAILFSKWLSRVRNCITFEMPYKINKASIDGTRYHLDVTLGPSNCTWSVRTRTIYHLQLSCADFTLLL